MNGSRELLTTELFNFCSSKSLSKRGIRQIFDTFGLNANNNDSNVSDYEFFLEACLNERVDEEIIQYLLDYFPDAINVTTVRGWTPLHAACQIQHIRCNTLKVLIEAAPDSPLSVDEHGVIPLQFLCAISDIDEKIAIENLKLLLDKCPESVRHCDNDGRLAILFASRYRSPEFCHELIKSYPGSEKVVTPEGVCTLHYACMVNNVGTVEYLYKLYPNAINQATKDGVFPIHFAIGNVIRRGKPADALDVVRFLLDCDPSVILQNVGGMSLFYTACRITYDDSTIEIGIQIIKALYDAHPEAIEDDLISSGIAHFHYQVRAFINGELFHAREAKNSRQMTTPNDKGQLPLHIALLYNVRLGSIKLLLSGNSSDAITHADSNGALPLHLACQYHNSPGVVQHLIDGDTTTLNSVDRYGDTALHYSCRGAKYETITMLLDKYDAVAVSKRNTLKKLPIELLFESEKVFDRESTQYTDSVFRLLKAYPETVTEMINLDEKRQAKSDQCSVQDGKKRKLDAL